MAFWNKKESSPSSSGVTGDNGASRASPRVEIPSIAPIAQSSAVSDAPVPSPLPKGAAVSAPQDFESKAEQVAQSPQAIGTLDPALAQKRAAESKRMLMAFGEVVSVLMRSAEFREMPLRRVEELVVPAILTGQFVVAEARSHANGFVTPVAAAMWATVSPEVDKRLSSADVSDLRLSPADWRSGDIAWLVAAVGDRRLMGPMLKNVQDNILKGRPLKSRVPADKARAAAPPAFGANKEQGK